MLVGVLGSCRFLLLCLEPEQSVRIWLCTMESNTEQLRKRSDLNVDTFLLLSLINRRRTLVGLSGFF